MAAVAAPADQAAGLLKNLSLDTQTKSLEISEPTKKPSVVSGDIGNGQSQPFERSVTPLIPDFMDPTVAYFPNNYASTPYYYGGYDGTTNEWDDYSRYMNPEGVDMPHGMYQGYGYAPYGPYSPAGSPVPTVGPDGPFYGAQPYQYPSPYFQPMPPTSGLYSTSSAPPKGDISASTAGDQGPLPVDTAAGNLNGVVNGPGVKGSNGLGLVRPTTYGSYGQGAKNAFQDPRFGFDGARSPIPWLDSPMYSNGQLRNNPILSPVTSGNGITSRNQNANPHSHLVSPRPISGLNTPSGYMNSMYPNKLYGQYGNTYRSGYGFGPNVYDSRASGRGWVTVDNKYRPRGRGNGFFGYNNENGDGLNELNRGPRARGSKNLPVTIAVKGLNGPVAPVDDATKEEKVKQSTTPDREQYNRAEFPETYTDAKFFVIKSYSEDDVHKSIKYNVWASTQNGNKKLDSAYQEAQQKPGECPVFLFFSVNTSGQFVGVAEMVGPVDFNKSLEYWQQDKWIGCFPVKWHLVKDLPNTLLKHIILENNENKPVTNSRDTQEVKFEQGLQMIKIFKEHSSKQCILDDFDFYEERQKRIQEKKAKQQQLQKQVWEGKPTAIEKINDCAARAEGVPPVGATPLQTNGDVKRPENDTVLNPIDTQKPAESVAKTTVAPEKIVANGVAASGC